jgi:glycine/D-amino acid oxidase-like deaminating enzyme
MAKSIWPSYQQGSFPRLEGSLEAEIIIVGAGIAGLTTAYTLCRSGLEVAVVDAGEPGPGETARTTAHLASVFDDRFVQLEHWRGEEAARLACESHRAAIDFIETLVGEHGISCDFQRLEGYLFAAHRKDADFLPRELAAARRAGHKEAELLARTPLPGLESHACIRFPGQATFNPGLYMRGLLGAVLGKGVSIFTGARVQSWEIKKSKVHLKTEAGHSLSCGKVVFCTNDPYVRLRYYTLHAPYRSYALALKTNEIPALPGLYWDTLDPYHYVRFAEDASGHSVLVVGGEDHKTGQEEHAAGRWDVLEAWARRHFPFVGECTARWSGQILETLDGLAFIGADPAGKGRVFLSSGDSGMGMTHGTLGALLLADLVHGRPHRWQELYDPGRFPWRACGPVLRENANMAAQYLHYLRPEHGDGKGSEGRRVQRGLRKVARQDGRDLCAVCPHLGGLVSWNDAEKTWDCECHGSRFSAGGQVVNGPAVSPLKPS